MGIVQLVHQADNRGGYKVHLLFGIGFHDIQTHGSFTVGGVKVNDVLGPLRRNKLQNLFDRIVGVNKTDTLSGPDILKNHVGEQNRLTHAGFSNDVHVALPVAVADVNR
ncbi:MAG: hypothetical protein ACD_52C00079G0001, partial [uncultured bacterium]